MLDEEAYHNSTIELQLDKSGYWDIQIMVRDSANFIVIENIPNFNIDNSNQQQRFVTLVDILYEKKIPLLVSSKSQLDSITSSNKLRDVFKRTISRLYELTSINYS